MKKLKIRRKPRELRINRSRSGDITIFILIILYGIFLVLPLVYALSNSLKPMSELWAYPPKFFVENPTLKNFKDLWLLTSDSWVPFSRNVLNTLIISVVGTGGHLLFSSMCAYVFAKHNFPGKNIMFSAVVLSLMFSTAVTAVPSYMIMTKLHLLDSLLSIILPAFGSSLGLYLMKQFMETNIPDTLLEAARIDGSSEVHTFFRIVMPLVKPASLTLIIFSFQALWNTGATSYIQSEQSKTLNYVLAQIANGGVARQGATAAAAIIMMLVPIFMFVVSQSNIVETVATSGMKD